VRLAVSALLPMVAWADGRSDPADLAKLSLEDLMHVKVTSVTRKDQSLARSAAAIFVITREDIKRSGATVVPELLRMVPGLFVSRLDGNKWGVASRGPGGRYVANMLVLVDGRTIYTPLFSGVLWENHEFVMEDIERIEVIRGPGAVVWGSNAVSGVVNIITRSAADTIGDVASVTAGTLDQPVLQARHGMDLGSAGAMRVFGRVARYGGMADDRGRPVEDGYSTNMGGFRLDLRQGNASRWMVEGSGQSGTIHQRDYATSATGVTTVVNSSGGVSAGHLLGRWTHSGDGGETRIQVYYDWFDRGAFLAEERHTADLDIDHGFRLGSRHGLMAGGGYRYSWDSIPATPAVRILPPEKAISLVNGYLQDEIRLAETVSVSLGARLEHSPFSGQSFQPAAQFLWAPGERHSVWASVSRAVRTPSRGEQGFSLLFGAIPAGQAGNPFPVFVTVLGQRDMHSEKLLSYEAGCRHQISARLSLDLAGYYYDYSQLRAFAAAGFPTVVLSPAPHINMDVHITNGRTSSNWGGEITANLKLSGRWRVFATYSHLEQRLALAPGMWNGALANLPHHLATVRSQMDLSRRLAFDTDVYSSGRQFSGLPEGSGGPLGGVQTTLLSAVQPGNYVRWDARLTCKVSPAWEVMAGGENLLDRVHKELEPEALMVGGQVRRSFFARLTWRR
jgi:iron complex outermembrane receptor protein